MIIRCITISIISLLVSSCVNINTQDITATIEHEYRTEKAPVNGTNIYNINKNIQERFKYIGYFISPNHDQTVAIIFYPASERYRHYKIGDTLINNKAKKYRLDITNIKDKSISFDLIIRENEPDEDIAKLSLQYAGHDNASNNNEHGIDYTGNIYRVRAEPIDITAYIDVFLARKPVLLDKSINSGSKIYMPFGKFSSINGVYNWSTQQIIDAGYKVIFREGTIIIKKSDGNGGSYINDTLPEPHRKICDKVETTMGVTLAKQRAPLDVYIRTFSVLLKNINVIRYPESTKNTKITVYGETDTDLCKLFMNIFNENNLYPEIVDDGMILHEGKKWM